MDSSSLTSILSFRIARRALQFVVPTLVSLLFVVAMPAQEKAGTATVEGRVLNPLTGDYLNNARVSIANTHRETFTDSTGAYRFTDVPAGTVTLQVFYTDLDPQEVSFHVAAGETHTQDFNLTSQSRYGNQSAGAGNHTIKLDPYVVAATRETDAAALATNEQRFAANIKNVVAADAFGDVSEGNVGEFVKFLPGVSIEYGAGDANDVVLRGLPPSFTPVTMDGVSVASATGTRSFAFDQVSINNASRVEIIKTQIPSLPANAIGGSVNMVSKRAFDRSTPQLNYRAFFTFTDEDKSLTKTPGPGTQKTPKARPGASISYIAPVTKNFGYTVTAMYSDQYGRERFSIPTWEYTTANGGSESNPFLRGYSVRDDPRETKRQSIGIGADWRPFKALTLTFNYQYNTYDLQARVNRLVINTGNKATSYDANETIGRANAGTVNYTPSWTNKFGHTQILSLKAQYTLGGWKADFTPSYSAAGTKYRDLDSGFFNTATIRINSPTVNYNDITAVRPREITVTSGGAAKDWTQLSNYVTVNPTSHPQYTFTQFTSGNLNLRREFLLGTNSAALQFGGAYQLRVLDHKEDEYLYSYLGPDGKAASADDSAAAIIDDVYIGQDPGFGWPANIQWPSMAHLAEVFRAHPEYFQLNQAHEVIERATDSKRLEEGIYAAYVQGELKLLDNRLSLVGGVRFEHTADKGTGLLRDRDAIYQHDANGGLVLDSKGKPILITSDTTEQDRLQYIERGSSTSKSYDGYYPSVALTYNIRPNLLLRVGISKSVGRPDFSNIIANFDVDQINGTIQMNNPGLKPWSSTNYDVSLEYYFKKSGTVSIGAFHKDISNAFGTLTYALDDDLLQQFGLSDEYLGYDLTTKFNTGTARITGYEANYQQRLTMLPSWAKGLSVFANATMLDLSGNPADFTGFIKEEANWGFAYSRGRIELNMNWDWHGKQIIGAQSFAPDAVSYVLPRLTVDAGIKFHLSPKLSLFLSARNLNKGNIDRVKVSSKTPDYAALYQRNIYNVKFAAGISGKF